nr:MarR family transcriptional regulator [Atopococcus tabaci]
MGKGGADVDTFVDEVNQYLVTIFNEVLMIEEEALRGSRFKDISIKEMHTIEAIGMYRKHTTTQVAKKLGITAGTLTTAINNLEKKGYVERVRSEEDRRVVKLGLTQKGRLLYRLHDKFHRDMVKYTVKEMSEEEVKVLMKGLRNLHDFLDKTKNSNN